MKYLIYILLILGIGGCENDRQFVISKFKSSIFW